MAAEFQSSSPCNGKWFFTREQIENSPSRRAGLDPDKELSYRQQAANLLQDMGQRLNVSQLTINTAIVYMHRFYMIQSFTRFHRNVIVPATLFLAAKVEEQPRKLEYVIKVMHALLNPQDPSPDVRSEAYLQQAQDLVILESIILQTLAFEITIDHPHTHVVKCTQLVRELTHEFLQILEKTPSRLKRIRNYKAGAAPKKSKVQEGGDQTETMMSMISMASSESALAGLMSMSAPPSMSSGEEKDTSGMSQGTQQYWHQKVVGGKWPAPPAKVSLSEYRAKHAEELAAHKRTLENMEANVKEQYATAAQALIVQQRKDKTNAPHQRDSSNTEGSNPSPIIVKIPVGGSEKTERHAANKQEKLLKLRLPAAGPGEKVVPPTVTSHSRPEEIKVRIKVPVVPERQSSPDEGSGKHKDRYKGHSTNHHHHHHHHHQQQQQHSYKHGGGSSIGSKHTSDSLKQNASQSSTSSSRKRPFTEDMSTSSLAASHNHQPKVNKSSRNSSSHKLHNSSSSQSSSQQCSFSAPSLLSFPSSLMSQAVGFGHGKGEKVPVGSDSNGHGVSSQSNEYQDTFEMLNSLLSAQGVQPAQAPMFDYMPAYRFPGMAVGAKPSGTESSRPPPLPAEPPPPLPPLPK
ncbi:cyclin-T1 isoform X2 [Erpetoichthys calabaricus]|uniref:cyclin-T1 isoform X2 n=1 Tax=Erpetoichthys calabaricus TaxID=27687 RepID=UPI002234B315|nr:cyclin-T1 isoform X2 [Erpetoichthys calabaricus]